MVLGKELRACPLSRSAKQRIGRQGDPLGVVLRGTRVRSLLGGDPDRLSASELYLRVAASYWET
jgi:hypothetical protein